MFLLLIVVGSIGSIIALLLVVALFSKKSFALERTIVINRTPAQVFDYVRILGNQDHYNKWWQADPEAVKEFIGTDGTVGFIAKWSSKNNQVGEGAQEIKKIVPGARLDFEIRFVRPFAGTSHTFMTTEPSPGGATLVRWGFTGSYAYPMNAMLLFLNMDKLLGRDLVSSLEKLKQVLEN